MNGMPHLQPYDIYRIVGLAVLGCGVFAICYIIAAAPSRVASRLGLRGLKRQRAIANNETWASVEPFVRWLGVRLSGIPSEEQYRKLDEQIALAGDFMGLTADEFLALMFIGSIGGLVAGIVLGVIFEMGALMVVIMTPVGFSLPYMQISGVAQDRMKAVSRGLPYIVDLMALCMGAGLDFPGTIRQVIDKSSNPDDPVVEEFTLISQGIQLGRTRREVLIEFARRCPVEVVKEFTGALIQAEERGNPVADVLQIQAGASRMRRSVRAEEGAAKAGVQMIGPLMLVFGTVMCLIGGPMFMSMKKF
jgi:tight adherence protein C